MIFNVSTLKIGPKLSPPSSSSFSYLAFHIWTASANPSYFIFQSLSRSAIVPVIWDGIRGRGERVW